MLENCGVNTKTGCVNSYVKGPILKRSSVNMRQGGVISNVMDPKK